MEGFFSPISSMPQPVVFLQGLPARGEGAPVIKDTQKRHQKRHQALVEMGKKIASPVLESSRASTRTSGLPQQRGQPGDSPSFLQVPFFCFQKPVWVQNLATWAQAAWDRLFAAAGVGGGKCGWLLPSGPGCKSVRVMLTGGQHPLPSPQGRVPTPAPAPGTPRGHPLPFSASFPGASSRIGIKRRYLLGPTRLFQEYLTLPVPPGNQTSGSTSPISQLWQPKLPLVFLFVTEPPR